MKPSSSHPSQRGTFFWHLYDEMEKNKDIIILTGDLGFGLFDYHRQDFPDQFYNVGASEQCMVGMAVGLALSGKIPFVYSITPFLLSRPYETIRNYINHEGIPVKLIGGGRGKDYEHDGFSHDAFDDSTIMNNFPNVNAHWPDNNEELPELIHKVINSGQPEYINLRR